MRRWWKTLGMWVGGLISLGGMLSSANAQFPPPGGDFGPPPGYGGPPPGMGFGGGGPPPGYGGPPPGAFNMGQGPAMSPDFPNRAPPSKEPASPFSVKEEGLPNAFGWDHPPIEPLRFQLSFGYSLLWYKSASLPPLVTTGSVNDVVPGAVGQGSTVILAGGPREPGISNAFRTTLTYWLIDPEICAVDANFFIMEQRSLLTNYKSNKNGSPVLARPFLNAATGSEDADPRALPGIQEGTLSDNMRTRLMGAEVNFKHYSGYNTEGFSLASLIGFRWLRLDERYSSFDTVTDLGGTGFNTSISDSFTTYNQYFAGQVGADLLYKWGRFSFAINGKVAVGENFQTAKINGQTIQTDQTTGTTVVATNQGLFAQPTNVGVYRTSRLAILPEAGVKVDFNVTERIRFSAGYTYLFLTNVVRPGDQINRSVNVQPLGTNGLLPPASPGPLNFSQSVFDAQMVNLAIEFLF